MARAFNGEAPSFDSFNFDDRAFGEKVVEVIRENPEVKRIFEDLVEEMFDDLIEELPGMGEEQ